MPVFEHVTVVSNELIARDTFRIRLECSNVAKTIKPGQFVMLRWDTTQDPLLGRPFALYDTVEAVDGSVIGLDVVYLVAGKLTSRLKDVRMGDRLALWGPLGNGFEPRACDHLIMVAGGIGQTPFLAVAKAAKGIRSYDSRGPSPWCRSATLCYGARSAEFLAGLSDFTTAGVDLRLTTDDGSLGQQGFVTEVLESELELSSESGSHSGVRVLCCGPEPMMAETARICGEYNVDCEVSLETPMACGIGACFTCVARIRQPDGSWDYRRTCIDGPVFDAKNVLWDGS